MVDAIKREIDTSALWMNWIGNMPGVISFFILPLLFGGAAIILGIITLFSKTNDFGWWSMVLGFTSIIVHWLVTDTLF